MTFSIIPTISDHTLKFPTWRVHSRRRGEWLQWCI